MAPSHFVLSPATVTLAIALAGASALLLARPAAAYLMLVRQGQESADLPQIGDRLGTAVAAGDFDNDGYDDLATAAPFENEDIGVSAEHGSIIVNYGSARGITHSSADYLTVGAVVDTDVHYGWAMAVGDFDNDGYDDLAVGLPDLDGTQFTIADAGEIWIHEGGAQGLPSSPTLTLTQDKAGDAIEAGDRFGYSLAAGDFNDDGFDDLAVGAIGEDSGSGAVSVFYGSATGITTSGAQTYRPIHIGSTPEAGGAFGWSLAAGELFDTAHDDLAIGAPFRMAVGQATAGMVFVMKGSATGLTTSGALIYDETAIGFTAEATNQFGYALAIGAISEVQGTRQLAVGSPGYDGGTSNRGQVFLIADFVPPFAQSEMTHIVQGFGGVETGESGDQFGSALAVADFDLDGRDDLAVAAPFENLENNPITGVNTTDAGVVLLYPGAFAFPALSGNTILHARALNDTIQTSDQLGTGLAFGRFDDSGRPNLAIGCPGKDDRNYRTGEMTANAGQVYIYAPWRQITASPHRSSIALDCAGRIIFAQRPFQAVPPASTTKAMTALLAVEAIQNETIDSNYVYTVPEWVANSNKVSGSQAGLTEGQMIRFVDLIKLAISVSAGDACYAIGDILTGGGHVWNGLEGTIPEFAAGMNTRADQLGMLQTNFTNPSGRPLVNHFTTAYDFGLLARQAMTNPLFRYFVGTTVWADIPNWPVTSYGWLQSMKSGYPDCDGVKPGGNGLSLKTSLAHATDTDGDDRVVASMFGVPAVKYGSPFEDAIGAPTQALMALAASDCPPGFQTPPPPPDPEPWATLVGIPTGPGPDHCVQVYLDDRSLDDALVEVWPQVVPGDPAMLRLFTSRSSELYLQPGEQVIIAFEHGDAHNGFVIGNLYNSTASLEITLSEPAGTTNLSLPGGAEHMIAADGSIADFFELQIRNTSSSAPAWLNLEALGFTSTEAVGGRAHATASLGRPSRLDDEVVTICVGGLDPMPGNEVYLVIRPSTGIVAVDPAPTTPSAAWATLSPNPFRGTTSCAFTLSQGGPVWLTVHDVAGRRVRTLAEGEQRPAGPHVVRWDGTDESRRALPAGIYFLRLRTAEGEATQKAVRVE